MLTLTLYLLLRGREEPWCTGVAGLSVAYAYVIRPSNMLSLGLVTLYVALERRRELPAFLLGVAFVLGAFVAHNLAAFGAVLPPYFRTRVSTTQSVFWEALVGHLVSPARGLFVWVPVFLFSFYGMSVKWKRGQWERLDWVLVVALALHWLAISTLRVWWAGHSIGPRYWADLVPFWVYFLIPAVDAIFRHPGLRRKVLGPVFGVLLAFGFVIHGWAAVSWEVQRWNSTPRDARKLGRRVWDWRDPQFLRGLLIHYPRPRHSGPGSTGGL
jgi:hypothetical protein